MLKSVAILVLSIIVAAYADPDPQGQTLQFSKFSQIPQSVLKQLPSSKVEQLRKALAQGGTIGGGGGGGRRGGGGRIEGGGGGRNGGGGETEYSKFSQIPQSIIRKLPSAKVQQFKKILAQGGTIRAGGGRIEVENTGGGGGNDGGGGNVHRFTGKPEKRVHRIPGERKTRVHRVTGKTVTNEHSFRTGGGGGPRPGGNGGSPGGPSGPSGPSGPDVSTRPAQPGKNGDTTCRKSGLTHLADKLNRGLQGLVNKLGTGLGANKPKTGLLTNIIGGAQTGLDNTLGGLDQGVSDFFCGFNRVFNKIGSKVKQGKLLTGALSAANVFISGAGSFFGNLGANGIDAITSAVSDAVHGRRSKKEDPKHVVHSTHGDLTGKVDGF